MTGGWRLEEDQPGSRRNSELRRVNGEKDFRFKISDSRLGSGNLRFVICVLRAEEMDGMDEVDGEEDLRFINCAWLKVDKRNDYFF